MSSLTLQHEGDGLFRGLPGAGEGTLAGAVEAILRRAAEHGVGGRDQSWSLAELRPEESDFEWLLRWAAGLKSWTVRRALVSLACFRAGGQDVSFSAGTGLLLMLLAAEVARREAREDYLWPAVREVGFREDVLEVLFWQGQPTFEHKDALEAAARRFNLRHVFGISGLQNWFDSVRLQFGFTRNGFARRLPEWLVGLGRTHSINRLLTDPALRSQSFEMMWRALHSFRRGNLAEANCRQELARSPWVLPEWIGELCVAARTRMDLVVWDSSAALDTPPVFLDEPQLRWLDGEDPVFTCVLINLGFLDLSEPSYTVNSDGRPLALIRRQEDGSYAASQEEIQLPLRKARAQVDLVGRSGTIADTMLIELWDPEEELSCYSLPAGRRIGDPWNETLKSKASYALVVSADLEVYPRPRNWCLAFGGDAKIVLIPGGWGPDLRIELEGDLFWSPSGVKPGAGEEPSWATGISLSFSSPRSFQIGDEVELEVQYPEGVRLLYVRHGGRALGFSPRLRSARVEALKLDPDSLSDKVVLRMGVSRGPNEACIRREVPVVMSGAAVLTPGGWRRLEPGDPLSAKEAGQGSFKVLPPSWFENRPVTLEEWALVEGDVWVGALWRGARHMPDLAGWGAALTVRKGPYNSRSDAMVLASEVVNRGIIEAFFVTKAGRYLEIKLTEAIEPGEGHHLVMFGHDGSVRRTKPTGFDLGKSLWTFDLNREPAPVAIGIDFEGHRMGACWSETLGGVFAQAREEQASRFAALVRWLHVPILGRIWYSVATMAHRWPHMVLPAWLGSSGLPEGLISARENEGWFSAVRQIFRGFRPDTRSACAIVDALAEREGLAHLEKKAARVYQAELARSAAARLVRVDPLLMGRVLAEWLRGSYVPAFSAHQAYYCLVRPLGQDLLGVTDIDKVDQISTLADITQSIAATLGIDVRFVDRSLDEAARSFSSQGTQPLDLFNVYLLLSHVETFRRLLGYEILLTLNKCLGGGQWPH